jgi:TPR repeat protein
MGREPAVYDPYYLHNVRAYEQMCELEHDELVKLADEGEPYALVALGAKYSNEDEDEHDLPKAADYYKRAAEKGLAFAQVLIGECYRDGAGVEASRTEAKTWFQKAAVQGALPAMHQLALYHYEDGKLSDSMELLFTAAEGGFAPSQLQLGNLYEYDKQVGINYDEAFKWVSKAAVELPDGKYELARMLKAGRGCETDPMAALVLFEEVSKEGHLKASFQCGLMHWLGEGTVRDVERGARFIEWAAGEGHLEAQEWLHKHNNVREAAIAFSAEHDIDDWLNVAEPSQAAWDASAGLGWHVDEKGLPGRANELEQHGAFALDSHFSHYRCPSCKLDFAAAAVGHIPKVFYRNWDELLIWLHLMAHLAFDEDECKCPTCGAISPLAFIDLFTFNSQLEKDLVLRTMYPDRENVPLSYKCLSWSAEDGYQRIDMNDINAESLALDAMVRRIGVMLEFEGLEAVKEDLKDCVNDSELAATLLEAIPLINREDKRLIGLGEFACHQMIETYPYWADPYAILAECYMLIYAEDKEDAELKEQINKILLVALSLNPLQPLALHLRDELLGIEPD